MTKLLLVPVDEDNKPIVTMITLVSNEKLLCAFQEDLDKLNIRYVTIAPPTLYSLHEFRDLYQPYIVNAFINNMKEKKEC